MKRTIILILVRLFAPLAIPDCGHAYGQSRPATQPVVRRVGVFAQPAENLRKWYGGGARVFIGWASSRQTSGVRPDVDRAEQLAWRAAVRAVGPDAVYVDYVRPDWKLPATAADVKPMLDDPQCLGFFGPEEFNRKKDGRTIDLTLAQWNAYWAPVVAADPAATKIRLIDCAGDQLTAAWGSYTGADLKPYFEVATDVCANWHPRNKYGDALRVPSVDAYPGRAVAMLRKVAPTKRRWYIAECAREELSEAPTGRAPTDAEAMAQFDMVMADDDPAAPIVGYAWFPQKPRPSAAHLFDNTTTAEFATVRRINAAFAPQASPATLPTTQPTTQPSTQPAIPTLEQRVADLEAWRARVVAPSTQPAGR